MHAQVSLTAFNSLPQPMQEQLSPYLNFITNGAMDPDLILQDWMNHDLNIHAAEKEQIAAAARITQLYKSIANQLTQSDTDFSRVAYEMGMLSHYLADINQPLHTDQLVHENLLHSQYESDVYFWHDKFFFSDSGVRLRFDPLQMVRKSAAQANRFYYPVYSSYLEQNGFENCQGITWINVQRAVEDIRDTWLTLWLKAKSTRTNLALWSSKKNYSPGEAIKITLSTLQSENQSVVKADLYIAALSPSGEFWFLNEQSRFVHKIEPHDRNRLTADSQTDIFNNLVWPGSITGEYRLYALFVKQGAEPTDTVNWLSNIAALSITLSALEKIQLNQIKNESYLFAGIQPGSNEITPLPLQRWDIIFMGDLKDDPLTPAFNEAENNIYIPGDYDHILIYLGRNSVGTAYAMELTHSFVHEIVDFRLIRLPEFYNALSESDNIPTAVVTKPVWQYQNRWSKRLIPSELEKLVLNEKALLHNIEHDWLNLFPYQLEYEWSGDFNDKKIYLVDDGLQNGASCTDYWLTLFESIGGVCLHNARMNAGELNQYYSNDSDTAQTPLPASLNPFDFTITTNALLNFFNFELIDPPAHIFSCDATQETGVAMPGRLIASPQLEEITPAMEINDWP